MRSSRYEKEKQAENNCLRLACLFEQKLHDCGFERKEEEKRYDELYTQILAGTSHDGCGESDESDMEDDEKEVEDSLSDILEEDEEKEVGDEEKCFPDPYFVYLPKDKERLTREAADMAKYVCFCLCCVLGGAMVFVV